MSMTRKILFSASIMMGLSLFGSLHATIIEGDLVSKEIVFTKDKIVDNQIVATTSLTTMLYEVKFVTSLELVPVEVPVLVCTDERDNGGGEWYGFYEVRRADKPAALAKAIKGVGEILARDLTPYFAQSAKPRTWKQFSRIIKIADKEIGKGLAKRVLVQYGNENMKNLGYLSTDCVVQMEQDMMLELVEKKIRTPYQRVTKAVTLRIDNIKLLSGEKEVFEATFDGFKVNLKNLTNYHQFTQLRSYNGEVYEVDFEANRNLSIPQNNVSVSLRKVGGQLQLRVLNPKAQEERELNIQTVVHVEIYRDGFLMFNDLLKTDQITLTGTETLTMLDLSSREYRGKSLFVTYKVQKVDSNFYTLKWSSKKDSEIYKL